MQNGSIHPYFHDVNIYHLERNTQTPDPKLNPLFLDNIDFSIAPTQLSSPTSRIRFARKILQGETSQSIRRSEGRCFENEKFTDCELSNIFGTRLT